MDISKEKKEIIQRLMAELTASKDNFATFIQADIYPHWREHFEHVFRERKKFVAALAREMEQVIQVPQLEASTFYSRSIAKQVLEKSLTPWELDEVLIQYELELVKLYRYALLFKGWPESTKTLLETQVEALHQDSRELPLNLHQDSVHA